MEQYKKHLIDSVVIICFLTSIATFAATFFSVPSRLDAFMDHMTAISLFCLRFFSFVLLLVVWNLHKRKYAAWLITVLAMMITLLLYIFHQYVYGYIIMGFLVYCLLILLGFHNSFRRQTFKPSLEGVLLFSIILVIFLLLNAAYGYFILPGHETLYGSMGLSLQKVFRYLFITGGADRYSKFIFVFIWVCVAVCVLFIMRPLVYRVITSPKDAKRARTLVLKYGQNPASYLALEADKNLFFGKQVEGVIAYGVVDNWVIVHADPICADADFVRFLGEFDAYCQENDYRCLFMSATDQFLSEYSEMGYDHVKCGEEARIKLDDYQLAGGKMAKVRALINHAVKADVTVEEYKPLEKKDKAIEQAINRVSEDWMSGKKSGKLVFSVGGVNLHNPLDRRYFYAKDNRARIVAFNVFLPFDATRGYMTDVTRRTHDAPKGVTEKITYDAFMKFKEEGRIWGSMGVSPLANVDEGDNSNAVISKVLELVYEKGSRFYGFKSLHEVKKRYAPTEWLPAYFVYSPKSISVDMAIAIVQLQNSGGIRDFIKSQFKKRGGK